MSELTPDHKLTPTYAAFLNTWQQEVPAQPPFKEHYRGLEVLKTDIAELQALVDISATESFYTSNSGKQSLRTLLKKAIRILFKPLVKILLRRQSRFNQLVTHMSIRLASFETRLLELEKKYHDKDLSK